MRLIFGDRPGKYSITERIKGVIPIEGNREEETIHEKYNILSIKPPDSIVDLLDIKSKSKFNHALLLYIAYENENAILPCRYGTTHYFDYTIKNIGWRSRFIEYEPSESEVLYKHMTGEFVTQEIAEKIFNAAPFLFLDKNKYCEEMKKILNE